MDVQRLVAMANDIAAFFDAESDKAVAAEGVRFHMTPFLGSAHASRDHRARAKRGRGTDGHCQRRGAPARAAGRKLAHSRAD